MSIKFTLGRIHGAKQWSLLIGPEQKNSAHSAFWNGRQNKNNVDSVYAEVVKVDAGGMSRKRFSAPNGAQFESSSSQSSSSSSTAASFSSSSSSSNSSSSSSHSRSSSSTLSSSSSSQSITSSSSSSSQH